MAVYFLSISWQQILPSSIPTLWVLIGGCVIVAFVALIFVLLVWAENRWQLLKRLRLSRRFTQIDAVRPYANQVLGLDQFRRQAGQFTKEAQRYAPDSVTKKVSGGQRRLQKTAGKALPKSARRKLPRDWSDDLTDELEEQWEEWQDDENGAETDGSAAAATATAGSQAVPAAPAGLAVGRVTTTVEDLEERGFGQRLVPGQQLGRYQVDAVIGEGPMGTTYQGYHFGLGRKVTIKVFHAEVANRSGFRERFTSAMQTVANLDHPSIAAVEHYESGAARAYLVRQFLPGPTLEAYVARLRTQDEALSLAQNMRLVAQVAEALAHAHQHGLVHARIRLENVLLQPLEKAERAGDPPLRAVLTDFAMARLFAEGLALTETVDPDLFPYLSPEQCQERPLDSRSDIYSLGVLLYRVTTGRFPFTPDSLESAKEQHVNESPPSPSRVYPLIPESLDRIILKALAKDPARRFQNGEEMARALRTVVPAAPVTGTESGDVEGGDLAALSGDQLVITQEGESERLVPLSEPLLTVGSDPGCDIVLAGRGVAEHHINLVRSENGWRVVDHGDLRGTYIDSVLLLPDLPEDWETEQVLQIGPYQLRWMRPAPIPGVRSTTDAATGFAPVAVPLRGLDLALTPENVAVTPGDRADAQISIENRSAQVDHVELTLEGIPLEWVTISENDVQLMPGGRGFVLLTMHPPQTSGAAAGDYPFTVRAQSRANRDVVVQAKGVLTVRPYHKLSVDMQPERLRNRGTCELRLRNEGNTVLTGTVNGRDPAESLHFTPQDEPVELAPGDELRLPLDVAPPRRPLLGSPEFVSFEVAVQTTTIDAPLVRAGQLEIRPLIPMWVPAVLSMLFLFLCVGIALLSSLWGDRRSAQATATAAAVTAGTATAAAAVVPPITPTVALPTSTPTPIPNPATCAAIRLQDSSAADGDYTIYLNGNLDYPFNIYCHDMAGSPAEYLTLANNGEAFNYALISHPEGALVTHYRRIRLDPASLVVDIRDRTFATFGDEVPGYTIIPLDASVNYAVTFSDYGRAEGCNRGNPDAPPGEANIDLNGTAFVLADTVTFTVDGNAIQLPSIEVSEDRKVAELAVGGRCGQVRPVWPLKLAYVSPVADTP